MTVREEVLFYGKLGGILAPYDFMCLMEIMDGDYHGERDHMLIHTPHRGNVGMWSGRHWDLGDSTLVSYFLKPRNVNGGNIVDEGSVVICLRAEEGEFEGVKRDLLSWGVSARDSH